MEVANGMRSTERVLVRVGALLVSAALLAACGSSQVVRRSGGERGPVQVSKPRYGVTTTVQRGQTLYRIATDNGIAARDLAAWNGIAPPYTIYPGQRLRLYPGGGSRHSGSSGAVVPRQSAGTPRPPATPVAAPPSSPFPWRWPVDGTLLTRYAAGEPTQQGIDIGGSAGAPVRAAADGVVVYSGSGLVGYGELIIVKHNEQWLSAYGHNRARLVNEGQVVKAGQQIAELGHSGAPRDMLHFEIRYNGKQVDPLSYLPKR
jgi:lipoprotein NlpD